MPIFQRRSGGQDRRQEGHPSDRRERRGVMAALDASHPLVWFDGSGRVQEFNDRMRRMLDCGEAEPGDWTYASLFGIADAQGPYVQTQWQRIASGDLISEERGLMRRNGTEIWSSISYAAILNADGSARRVLAIVIDLAPWSWRPKQDGPLILT